MDYNLEGAQRHIHFMDSLPNIEEKQYCCIKQTECPESEMVYIKSQREWVCIDSIDEYLQMHYINSELGEYNKVSEEIEILTNKNI